MGLLRLRHQKYTHVYNDASNDRHNASLRKSRWHTCGECFTSNVAHGHTHVLSCSSPFVMTTCACTCHNRHQNNYKALAVLCHTLLHFTQDMMLLLLLSMLFMLFSLPMLVLCQLLLMFPLLWLLLLSLLLIPSLMMLALFLLI